MDVSPWCYCKMFALQGSDLITSHGFALPVNRDCPNPPRQIGLSLLLQRLPF
jgi:hypothetical protein